MAEKSKTPVLDNYEEYRTIVKFSGSAGGATCPKCNQHAKLFFGDSDGDHWCLGCQLEMELKTLGVEKGGKE